MGTREVLIHTVMQVLRLAHVDDFTILVFHLVTARFMGQIHQLRFDIFPIHVTVFILTSRP